MRRTYGWKRAFRWFRNHEDEVRAELQAHVAARAAQLRADGLSSADAREKARAELGETTSAIDAAVGATVAAAGPAARWVVIERLSWLGQDARYALRGLRRRPGFGLAAVSILALVIAANATVFAVVSAYLLRALPYPEADRVTVVTRTPIDRPTMSSDAPVPSGLNSIEWPRTDSIMEYSAAWELDGFGLLSGGEPEVVGGAWVTAGYFAITGARTRLGRVFTEQEVRAEAPVAVISHGLWERRYGADSQILGKTLTAFSADRPDDAETFEIIGVLSPDFWMFNEASDLLVPLRGTRRPVLVRLAPGVSAARAAVHLTGIARSSLDEVDPRWAMHVTPLQKGLYQEVGQSLRVLAGGSILLLLIAGANLLVLLLIRTAARDLELSIRSALGAGRGRMFRQLAVEGFILALVAGGTGLWLASLVLGVLAPTLQQMIGAPAPGGDAGLSIDGRVVGLVVAVSSLVAIVFGWVPVLIHRSGFAKLRSGRGVRSVASHRFQWWLITAETAMSLALLIGAGLLVRSTTHAAGRGLGFDPAGVEVGSIALRDRGYPDDPSRLAFMDQVLAAYATGRGSAAAEAPAAVTDMYPYGLARGERFAVGDVDPAITEEMRAIHHSVGEDYFEVLNIPLASGRAFTATDDASAEPVIIISRSLADRLWPGEEALGRKIRTGSWDNLPPVEGSVWRRVIGVAADVRTTRTDENWPDTYVPFRQSPSSHMHILLKTVASEDQGTAVARLRSAVALVDDRQPVGELTPLARSVDAEMARPRFMTGLLVGFALFALGLTLVGLHAVVSYAAAQRRREVAIRVALGARRGEVDRLLVRGGLTAAFAGVLIGLVVAMAGSRLLESQLYGLPGLQPGTYAGLALVALAATTLSVWITARRAGAADPSLVLREE